MGSGGNRVATRPLNREVFRCSSITSLIKSDGGDEMLWAIESVPFTTTTGFNARRELSRQKIEDFLRGHLHFRLLNISHPARPARPNGFEP